MIDKQTQDQAWKCLPKVFREAVKNKFDKENERPIIKNFHDDCPSIAYYNDVAQFLCDLFGEHNLSSDVEPEEMLIVEKGRVQFLFEMNYKIFESTDSNVKKFVFEFDKPKAIAEINTNQ